MNTTTSATLCANPRFGVGGGYGLGRARRANDYGCALLSPATHF